MKKIEDYIESIYRNFDEKDDETKILKEETRAHLVDEIEELEKSGLTEEESIHKALSNFGSEKIVINEMKLILKKHDKFSKILKKSAITFFIIACVFFSINIADGFIHRNDPNPFTADENTNNYVVDAIENKIKDKNSIDSELSNEITRLLDEFNMRTDNGLYSVKLLREGNYNVEYEYQKDIKEDMITNGNGGVSGIYNDEDIHTWDIFYKRTDKQQIYDSNASQEVLNNMDKRTPNRLGQISNYLFVVSVVLLCVYILNKIYLKSSLVLNLKTTN